MRYSFGVKQQKAQAYMRTAFIETSPFSMTDALNIEISATRGYERTRSFCQRSLGGDPVRKVMAVSSTDTFRCV